MTADEIKTARELCEQTRTGLDPIGLMRWCSNAGALLPVLLDALEAARRERDEALEIAATRRGHAIDNKSRADESDLALFAARRDLAEATARAEVQARQRAEDAAVMARQAGGVIARDARIAALENALDMAACALESRSDERFRRDCAAKARGVLQAKAGS